MHFKGSAAAAEEGQTVQIQQYFNADQSIIQFTVFAC